MAVETRVGEEAYRRLALAELDRKWELWDGLLRAKPPMTFAHNWLAFKSEYLLQRRLDWNLFQVRVEAGRLRRPGSSHYISDVFVLPTEFGESLRDRSDLLEVYDQPLPLVVEVWSPSTGGYDVDRKLPEHQRRGDHEIWRIHPYERTLTSRVRQPDGGYAETVHRDGVVRPVALPGVEIDPATLLAGRGRLIRKTAGPVPLPDRDEGAGACCRVERRGVGGPEPRVPLARYGTLNDSAGLVR